MCVGRASVLCGDHGEDREGRGDEDGVSFDGLVEANLGMVESEIVLGELETFLDGPAESSGRDEAVEGGGFLGGGIAVVVGAFSGGMLRRMSM